MSDFENARHQGYTVADLAADEAETTQRMKELGCFSCKYGARYKACSTVIECGYKRCPYRKEVQA